MADFSDSRQTYAGFYVATLIDVFGRRHDLDQIAALAVHPVDLAKLEPVVP